MRSLRLALAQINVTVGDLDGNARKILEYLDRALSLRADLVAFPELAVTGYPPEDLVFRPQFVEENLATMRRIVQATQDIVAVFGFVDADPDIRNAAGVAFDGKLVDVYHKIHLPNYGVFDEDRYFKPGGECPVYVVGGTSVGVNICEDIWQEAGPATVQAAAGAEVIVNINGSPFHLGKRDSREAMLAARALENEVFVAYLNLVGGQDELVFDGGSMVFDPSGRKIAQAAQFEEDLLVVDLEVEEPLRSRLPSKMEASVETQDAPTVHVSAHANASPLPPLARSEPCLHDELGEVYAALVTGTRDYVRKCGFDHVLVALSGGLDSSLVAVVAVDALGSENVLGVAMPSRYSSEGSLLDARALADNLGIELRTIPIEGPYSAFLEALSPQFQSAEPDATEENLQARVRGDLIMAVSNKLGWMVLTTGNKSEMATGYATLYGDMSGGFAVIKDVPKTMAYALAEHRNAVGPKPVIPRSVIEKPPSAELRPDQKDVDSLPPYDVLDPILKAYVEEDRGFDEILALGFDEAIVRRVIALVDSNEYKRRQAPPGIKITERNFGRDRRMPIANRYRPFR